MLQIDSQMGKLGLDIQPNNFQLQTTLPELKHNPTYPAVILDIKMPKVHIDQKEQFAQMGRQYPLPFTKESAQKGKSIATKGIQRRVAEGRQLADIHIPVNIGELTARREQLPRQKQLTIAMIPKTPPKIHFEIHEPQVRVEEGAVNGVLHYGQVHLQARDGQVNTYWLQKPHVNITYVGNTVDLAI